MRTVYTIPVMILVLILTVAPALAQESEKDFDAHATSYGYYFKANDMDFHFGNLVVGSAVNGGAEIGESFYVASQIVDGDAASWQREWYELAKRAEARGEESLAKGHVVSAREQLQRAAYYYRVSLVSMVPTDPEFKARGEKCRELMRKAGPMFSPAVEYIEVPFENTVLPGYFRAAPGKGAHRTLIMIGGGETFAEDLYFYIARQANERGYNFMTVDLPGQGMLPMEGHVFRTDTWVPMKAVVDYALSRSDVDPKGLAMYGFSGGGLFVPQAAEHDPRIRAVAMNSAVVDAYTLFSTMPATQATERDMASWTSFHAGVVKAICWRYGVPLDRPAELVDANKGNTFDPAKIVVPALIMVGEGEYKSGEVRKQQKAALDNFPNKSSRMVVTPTNEGATNHCVMENRSLVGQVLFDWLDEVLP